jgi:hypothetical protein
MVGNATLTINACRVCRGLVNTFMQLIASPEYQPLTTPDLWFVTSAPWRELIKRVWEIESPNTAHPSCTSAP